jgi:hypothetical protein
MSNTSHLFSIDERSARNTNSPDNGIQSSSLKPNQRMHPVIHPVVHPCPLKEHSLTKQP